MKYLEKKFSVAYCGDKYSDNWEECFGKQKNVEKKKNINLNIEHDFYNKIQTIANENNLSVEQLIIKILLRQYSFNMFVQQLESFQ